MVIWQQAKRLPPMPKDVSLVSISVQDMVVTPSAEKNIMMHLVTRIGLHLKVIIPQTKVTILMEALRLLLRYPAKIMVKKGLVSLLISIMSFLCGVLERQVYDYLSSSLHSHWHNATTWNQI